MYFLGGRRGFDLAGYDFDRYRQAGDEAGADRALSVVLNGMMVVLGWGFFWGVFAPLFTRVWFPDFDPGSAALCTSRDAVVAAGAVVFLCGGVLGSKLLVRKIFLYQAVTPLIYNLGIIFRGVLSFGAVWCVFAGALG